MIDRMEVKLNALRICWDDLGYLRLFDVREWYVHPDRCGFPCPFIVMQTAPLTLPLSRHESA
jgi:hypothetical protein